MPAATRVQVIPPAAWSEEELLTAVRGYAPSGKPVRPGDALAELVVVAVEPAPGASLVEDTELEIMPTPRRRDAPRVDLAVLLDVSESMAIPWDAKHTRIQAALASIESLLEGPSDSIAALSIYHYAKEPRLAAGPSSPRGLHVGEIPTPKGASHTASALNGALADLASRTSEGNAQVIMLLTDGVGEVAELEAAAARAGRLHVPVHSLVFAPEVDELFGTLADASGGSVQLAAHPLTIEFVHETGG